MKKIMTMVSALMVAATMNAEKVNNTEAFTETVVTVPARVRFVKGESYSYSVVSENKIVADCVKAAVANGVLSFNLANGLTAEEAAANDLTIVITAPGMPEFKTSRDMKTTNVKAAANEDTNSYTYNK